ncbi:MAG TPA: hypothetical protein VFI54_27390 [Solirubrobacteraceae bacterium]|nr:hypothetical protein [Solirubrobacteraceae bacterium]
MSSDRASSSERLSQAGAFASASSTEARNPNPAAVRTGRHSGQAGGFQ